LNRSPPQQQTQTSISSQAKVERQANNVSPNTLLYQKLFKMISSSSDVSVMSGEMNKLLENPVVKERLQRLHQQLLQNPGHFLPKFENIIRADYSSDAVKVNRDALAQDLQDLKNYYAKYGNQSSSSEKSSNKMTVSPLGAPSVQQLAEQQRLQQTSRVIDREFKRR
jgi:hypothetical protein